MKKSCKHVPAIVAVALFVAVPSISVAENIEYVANSQVIGSSATFDPAGGTPAVAFNALSENPWNASVFSIDSNQAWGTLESQANQTSSWNGYQILGEGSVNAEYSPLDFGEFYYTQAVSTFQVTFMALTTVEFTLNVAMSGTDMPTDTNGGFLSDEFGDQIVWSYSDDGSSFEFSSILTGGTEYTLRHVTSTQISSLAAGLQGDDPYQGLGGFNVALVTEGTVIPLPSAALMGLAGIGGLAIRRRRREV